jgi:hypothetical protein
MTTTRDSVLAASREHMDKEASILGQAAKAVGGVLSRGTGRVGNVGSRLVDRGERMVARTAATTAAKAQNRVIDKALANKLPSLSPAQQVRTRDAVNARSAQRLSEANRLPPAMAERAVVPTTPAPSAGMATPARPMTDIPPAPTPPPGIATPAAPASPAAPTAEVTPGTPSPMISSNAKKYLAIGAGGLAGGAMLSGGISGGAAAGRQQQMAPTAYPPGY